MLSKQKPWLKYYPKEIINMEIPNVSLNEYLRHNNLDEIAIEYYGNQISWKEIWNKVDVLSNCLYEFGVREGDQIPVFLHAVPEFLYILLAAERLGASILCRDGSFEENTIAVEKSRSKIVFVHDYHPQKEIQAFINMGVNKIISLSPYSTIKKIPKYVKDNLDSLYEKNNDIIQTKDCQLVDYNQFLFKYNKNQMPQLDISNKIPLLRAYTTGTTGVSKQVVHSAQNIIGILHQMNIYSFNTDFKFRWLHTVLPPSLVAVTVSMMLSPLSSGKLLVLDPFVNVNDIDLSLIYNKPNGWAMIPMYTSILLNSDRLIGQDLSFFMAGGTGAEFLNNRRIKEMQDFFKAHKSNCVFTTGYGMSEAGSNCTIFSPDTDINDFCYGIPLPLTTISIFKEDTEIELEPGELGEICISGPGVMLGYDDDEITQNTVRFHSDGLRWLHTGDIGYMNEKGHIYCLNRGFVKHFTGNNLFVSEMENKIINIEGIKDAFFVTVKDSEHDNAYIPYLYVVKNDNHNNEDIKNNIKSSLEDFEMPKEIVFIDARPYFHFKTARKILAQELEKNIF